MFEKMSDKELEEYIIKLDKENKLSKYDEKTQIMVKLYRNSIDAQHSQFYAIKNAKLVLLLGTPKEKIKNFWAAYSSLNDAIPGIDWIKKYKK
ncbi:MAG: hypothetical protein LBV51_00630, partial [Acholeplasmatales bacterium]|nr:hypothetical protein [Acholeplasmatales bacterium]